MNNDEWNYLLSFQVWKLVDRRIQIHVTDGDAVFVVLKIIHFNGLTNFCWNKYFKCCCRIHFLALFWENNDCNCLFWSIDQQEFEIPTVLVGGMNLRHLWELKDSGGIVSSSKCKQMSLNPFVNSLATSLLIACQFENQLFIKC